MSSDHVVEFQRRGSAIGLQSYALRHRDRIRWAIFSILGVILLSNVNVVADYCFDRPQLFSPVIRIVGLLAVMQSPFLLRRTLSTEVKWLTAAFAFYIAIACIAHQGPFRDETVTLVRSLVTNLVLLVSVTHVTVLICCQNPANHRRVLLLMYFGTLFSSASVFLTKLIPDFQERMFQSSGERYSGVFANPNELGCMAVMCVVFGAVMSARTLQLRWSVLSLCVGIAAAIMSQSKMAILSVPLVAIVLLPKMFPERQRAKLFVFAAMLLVAVTATGIAVKKIATDRASNKWTTERFSRLIDLTQGKIDNRTTGYRTDAIRECVRLWRQEPLFGRGLGEVMKLGVQQQGPHNVLVLVLGEAGIFAAMFLVVGWGRVGLHARRLKREWVKTLVIGVFCALTLNSMTSHNTLMARDLVFILATTMGLAQYADRVADYPGDTETYEMTS